MSRLDPQVADFARRAAELWTQVLGLRELCAELEGKRVQNVAAAGVGRNHTGDLARVVEQVIQREMPYPHSTQICQ